MASVRHIRNLGRKFDKAAGLPVREIPRSTRMRKLWKLLHDWECTQKDISAEIERLAAQADAEGRDGELYKFCRQMRDDAYRRLEEIEARIADQKAKIIALDAAKRNAPKEHIEAGVAAWARVQELVKETRKRKNPIIPETRKEMRKDESEKK
jgi:hypothetical protein